MVAEATRGAILDAVAAVAKEKCWLLNRCDPRAGARAGQRVPVEVVDDLVAAALGG